MDEDAKARFEDLKVRFEDLDKRIAITEKRFDDVVKVRFEELDKRVAVTEKRFDDVKYIAGFVSILLSVLAVIAGFNFSNERTWLRESVKDVKEDAVKSARELKEEVGKIDAPAILEMLGSNGQALSGQEIPGKLEKTKEGKTQLTIEFILRNSGNGPTGPMWVKAYSSDPIRLEDKSTDEPKFKYEDITSPEHMKPSELPGNISSRRSMEYRLASMPPPGKYPFLLKHYYGKGKIATATFTVVLSAAN